MAEARGRWVVAATVLGSGMAMLDATVVNVALPVLGRDLGASMSGLEWTLNAYTLTLASFILLGGALGDRFGRRRVFVIGTAWFAAASLVCGLAPNLPLLVAARALQGVGGALLTPGSLALIASSFHPDDRSKAIGAWSALGGVAGAVGPLLGGWIIAAMSWRFIFFINLPLAAAVIFISQRHVPETADDEVRGPIDVPGAVLGAVGLAGVTDALIEASDHGASARAVAAGAIGVTALVTFVFVERKRQHPMLPLELFASRQFTAANAVTLAVYAALGGLFFLLVLDLQVVAGYSPIRAGAALLPVTALLLLLSTSAGALAQRVGPRIPMALGPLVSAAGVLQLLRVGPAASYVTVVLPGVATFGLGLALTVAPLTSTVLAAVDTRHAGVASGFNNAVARAAGLLAVAVLPLAAGLHGDDYRDPRAFAAGFRIVLYCCASFLALGGLLAMATIRREGVPTAPPSGRHAHCAIAGPPLTANERG